MSALSVAQGLGHKTEKGSISPGYASTPRQSFLVQSFASVCSIPYSNK